MQCVVRIHFKAIPRTSISHLQQRQEETTKQKRKRRIKEREPWESVSTNQHVFSALSHETRKKLTLNEDDVREAEEAGSKEGRENGWKHSIDNSGNGPSIRAALTRIDRRSRILHLLASVATYISIALLALRE